MNAQKTANVQNAAHSGAQILARWVRHMAHLLAQVARCAAWHLANLAHGTTPALAGCAVCHVPGVFDVPCAKPTR